MMRYTVFLAAAFTVLGQQQPAAPGGRGSGQGGGAAPGRGAASIRWEAWSAMRSSAATILGWPVGIAAEAVRQNTLFESLEKTDALGIANLESSAAQKVNLEIPKPLGPQLLPGELTAVKDHLFALNVRMAAYRVPQIGSAEDNARKLFEFARNIGIGVIVAERIPDTPPLIDKLANEYNANVAVCGSPSAVLAAIASLSKKVGLCADASALSVSSAAEVKDRLMVLRLSDTQASGLGSLLREMYRLEIKPALLTVNATEPTLQGFEKVIHQLMAEQVMKMSRAAAIRGPDRLSAEERTAIDHALPQKAQVPAKKPRKLLVLDLNVAYPGHRSIPAENYGLEQMGKRTSAYEAVFNNDLDNLKYDRIKQFDAVFLNNTVGMIFVDPAVREGLTRFVREGGGLAGIHGVSHASMDWPEFSEMIGVRRGVHREPTEQAWVHIEDAHSPLTVPFGGKEFLYQDEFFRFPNPPYSRDKLHVLLTMDVMKTDMNQGRPCASPCVRADADYAVSWIRNYGQGRVFFSILGHNPTIFTTPALARYFLNGIQFILGDLDADATPSARQAPRRASRR